MYWRLKFIRKVNTKVFKNHFAATGSIEQPSDEENDDDVAESAVEASRTVFSRGWVWHRTFLRDMFYIITCTLFHASYDALKRGGLKEERMLLLEAWRDMEEKALGKAGSESAFLIFSIHRRVPEHHRAQGWAGHVAGGGGENAAQD